MSMKSIILESLVYATIFVMALGWLDVGQGPEYTWWNFIKIAGNW